jgi:hypothetical protein
MMDGSPYTLVEAKDKLREALMAGKIVDCPCCKQQCKIWRRKLDTAMSRSLIWLVQSYAVEPRWYHIGEFPTVQRRPGGGDFAKLRHWEMICEKAKEEGEDSKRTSGYWQPLPKATQFVNNLIRVPSHAFLYRNVLVEFEKTSTNVVESLGKKFNYKELLREAAL